VSADPAVTLVLLDVTLPDMSGEAPHLQLQHCSSTRCTGSTVHTDALVSKVASCAEGDMPAAAAGAGHEVCTKMRSLSPGVPPPIIMISGGTQHMTALKISLP
jgi:DNA-binding response OmpR family regulator